MYKVNNCFPLVHCMCGRKILLQRATVCECGATLRFRRVSGNRKLCQPMAIIPEGYNLANKPNRRPYIEAFMAGEPITETCSICGRLFEMGINGTIDGCDTCTGIRRDKEGCIIEGE